MTRTKQDVIDIARAIQHLRYALKDLKAGGAGRRSMDRVRLALRSAGGALRHATRVEGACHTP